MVIKDREKVSSNLEQKLRKEHIKKALAKDKKPKNREKKKEVSHILDEFLFREELGLFNTAKVDYQKLFDYLASYKKPELIASHENPIKPVFSCEGELTFEVVERILRKQKMDKIMTTSTMSELPVKDREVWGIASRTSTYFAQSTAFYDTII